LDLKRQGSLLPGFPLRLNPPEFSNAEFDGPPLVWGDLLIVALAQRDNVGLSRSVAAFDRFSGKLQWHTEPLAQGIVEGTDRANLIAHQLLTAAGGRLYYNTNLGSIVCLDPLTGQVEWLTRYTRLMARDRTVTGPDRFRYRDLTPCLVHRGLVVCAPQDCPEIFTLDATSGDLVWATDDEQVADAIHLLGVHEDSLLVSGDRLVWLDRLSGRTLSRFPASNTPGTVNALPSPRGLGRGAIADGQVYFPTGGEIFIFPARPRNEGQENAARVVDPPILRRVRLNARGKEGGNLVITGDWLLLCTPNRMFAFQSPTPGKPVSLRPRP
jgi:outer membrane protein assembly factor BamB